jgi:dolichyl-phosphate-mannose-protein mannosyltransferase
MTAPAVEPSAGASASGEADRRALVQLLVVAAIIRILGLVGPGHGGDIFAFYEWAEDAVRHGLGGYYAGGGESNYPPMLYLLWPLGLALDGPELAFAIRALSIPFDLGLGALLFGIGGALTGRSGAGLLAAGLYLLNPAVILAGPMWGQVDGMGALPMVAALVAVARGRVAAAGALAVVAGLVKPQFGVAAFVLAGLAVFWLRSSAGLRRIAILALATAATFLVLLLPLGLGPGAYLDLMGETFRRYPVHSGFAFNPWAMVFGFNHDDGPWFVVGATAELLAIGTSLWLLRWRRDLVGLLAVGSLIALTLYFVPTRAHERYLYGAIALLAPLAAADRRLWRPFVALSSMFFATLAYVLMNSPYRILPGEKIPDYPDWAISAISAAFSVIGLWTAWRLVQVLRGPGPGPAPEPVEARIAGSG